MGLNHSGRKGFVRQRSLPNGKRKEKNTRLGSWQQKSQNCGTQSSRQRQRGWESSAGMIGAALSGQRWPLTRSQRHLVPVRNSPTARKPNPSVSSLMHSQGFLCSTNTRSEQQREAEAPAAPLLRVLPQVSQLSVG